MVVNYKATPWMGSPLPVQYGKIHVPVDATVDEISDAILDDLYSVTYTTEED